MKIKQNREKGIIKFIFKKEISIEVSGNINKEINSYINKGYKHIIFDLKNVFYIDSMGIGVLVSCYSKINKMNGSIKLINLSKYIQKTLDMVQLEDMIKSCPTQKEKYFAHLSELASKSQIREDVSLLFKEFGINGKDLKDLGCVYILLDSLKNKFVYSPISFLEKDVQILEEWTRNTESNKINIGLYKLVFENNFFYFNKFRDKAKKKYVLIGILSQKLNNLKLAGIVTHSRQILKDIKTINESLK